MTIYLLDTNIASHIIRGDIPLVMQRLAAVSIQDVHVSVMTEAELRYGKARHPASHGLATRINRFLGKVGIAPWTSDVVPHYAVLRATRETAGKPLSPIDLLIAAHAKAMGATLVTRDASFALMPCGLALENWAALP